MVQPLPRAVLASGVALRGRTAWLRLSPRWPHQRRAASASSGEAPSPNFGATSSWLDCSSKGGLKHRALEWLVDGPGGPVSREEAPLLLFLHASSLCGGAFAPVVQRIPGICAVACDQRGHGDTSAPTEEGSYHWDHFGEDFLRIVEAVTEKYGRAPTACVTHSFAGDCAVMALSKRSVPVGQMILLDPVLADPAGVTAGARLAKGTKRLGEKEAGGFDSAAAVGEALEKVLGGALARPMDGEAKAAFAAFGSFEDAGRWRLKCRRENEAMVYANRVATADYLADKSVPAKVQILFGQKRRGKPEDQAELYARDWDQAERVVGRCLDGSKVHLVPGVGHFLILEAPEVVAEAIGKLL